MSNADAFPRIIIPGLTSEEVKSKRLAMQLLQTIEREQYTNREILGACAIVTACTIKARYRQMEHDQTIRSVVGMLRHVVEQG